SICRSQATGTTACFWMIAGRSSPNPPMPPACASCARRARHRPTFAAWSACPDLTSSRQKLSVTQGGPPWHAAGGAGLRGIMAVRARLQRRKRLPKKRLPKKRLPETRRKRVATAAPGVVGAALAAFAHEVRTPLTGILAISDLLVTSDLDERERRWVDTIKAGAEHLASLATLFVDAAKDASGTTGVRQDLFDLRPLARNAGDSLAGRATAKGLQWQGEISVKQLARSMGGDIKVAPRRGGGATFTLTVSLNRAKTEAGSSVADETVSPAQVPPLRVLSVEDNPFGRVVLNTILSELGHQAEFIGRGETATERIAQGGFDAVLMDMVLPGIPGIEAIRRIRQLRPPLGRIAIIGVSGRGEDETASRAAGADAFLLKPVSPRALATALLGATRRAGGAT